MQEKEKTVAVVTGGSSGIGRCVCESLAKKGIAVYELSRRNCENEGIFHIGCDVTDEAEVAAAVGSVLFAEGKIDILINCAGSGIGGAAEFTDTREAQRQLDINFFGTVRAVKAVLPSMRERKQGRIVNISSVASVIPIPFQTYYSVSKAAIDSYTAALANEVRPFNITVCAVRPGDIASGFTAARVKNTGGEEEYSGRPGRSLLKMEKDETQGMSPAVCGAYIARIALKRSVKPYYCVGFAYKLFCVLAKALPCGLVNRIIYILYAK